VLRQVSLDDSAMPAKIGSVGMTLGTAPLHFLGRIRAIAASTCASNLPPAELEKRLLEMGFVEDAEVEIRHEGLFGHDPIAVCVDGAVVALRRREAGAIQVEPLD
jgi:ferrous iron transport protein A